MDRFGDTDLQSQLQGSWDREIEVQGYLRQLSTLNQMKVEGGIELRIEHLTDMPRVLGSSSAAKKSTDLQNIISYLLNW